MIELPEFGPLRITQDSGKPDAKAFATLDHVVIVAPAKAKTGIFQPLPKRWQLKPLLDRCKRAGATSITTHLDNSRQTAISVSAFAPTHSFGTLTWARAVIKAALNERPGTLGLMVLGLDARTREKVLLALVAAAEAASFELPSYKSATAKRRKRLRRVKILAAKPRLPVAGTQIEAYGNNIARWFTALPPNELTARSYRSAVQKLAKQTGLDFEFIGESKLKKLGAGAFLAVAQGNSSRDAGVIQLKYRPNRNKRPDLALVGKGILFDTGGTNLKPFKSMLDMHTDMQGSAVALGVGVALAKHEVPFAFDVWLAVTENRISANAYKSQDVIVAANGKSIQVIHTDAEGRMVLADTLALAARTEPKLIIDYATLTGACVGALTDRYSGVFTNKAAAHQLLIQNGVTSGERVWPFPMDDDYDESLKSPVADIRQCAADGQGDHILAARFLQHFVPDRVPWIHMDLSASSRAEGLAHIPTEITGFGVRYTLELLRAQNPAELVAKLADS